MTEFTLFQFLSFVAGCCVVGTILGITISLGAFWVIDKYCQRKIQKKYQK